MDQSRSNTISEWSAAEDTLGPIPDLNNEEILKDLARCFTSKDNPVGTSRPNVQFQRYLTTTIRADSAYYSNPTLGRLCELVARPTAWVDTSPVDPQSPPTSRRKMLLLLRRVLARRQVAMRGLQQTEPLKGLLQTSSPSGLQQRETLGW